MLNVPTIQRVTFRCLDDEFWSVAEGGEKLASFFSCPYHQFNQLYHNAFLRMLARPKVPSIGGIHLLVIHGLTVLCQVTREPKGFSISIDKLPSEGMISVTNIMHVGLFRFSSDTTIQIANETFYTMLDCSKESFFLDHGNDLASLAGSFARESPHQFSLTLSDGDQRVLLLYAGETAGFLLQTTNDAKLQLYQDTLATSGIRIWEYDIPGRCVIGPDFSKEDLNALQPLHQSIDDGELSCDATVFLDGEDSLSHCYHIQYHRKDDKAFAIAQDVSFLPEQKRQVLFEEQFSHLNISDLLFLVKADLTNDHMTKIQKQGFDVKGTVFPTRYSDWIAQNLSLLVSEEDKKLYQECFSLEALLQAAVEGIHTVSLEFKIRDEFGFIRWLEKRAFLIKDTETEILYTVEISRYITNKKKLELALAEKAVRDDDTGFYDRNTIALMVSSALKNVSDVHSSYAFALIDIKGLKTVSSPVKHSFAPHLAEIIRLGLSESCIIGRFDASLFVVFFEQVDSTAQVRKSLERLVGMIANAYMFVPVSLSFWSNIGFSVGCFNDSDTYQVLFEKASLALDKAHEAGRNQIFSYDWEEGAVSGSTFSPASNLDENATGVLLGCMNATLASENLVSTLPLVLSQLGMYYKAKRVCLLTQEQSGILEISASWEPTHASHSYGVFETDPFADIPMIDEVVHLMNTEGKYTAPCFMGSDLLLGRLNVWGLQKGYLIVVSPSTIELSVVRRSAQLIASGMTKRRLLDRQEYLVYHDSMTGLKNYNGYNQYVSTLHEDALSSLGLVLLDINNLRDMNKNFGKEYGNEIIKLITVKLQQLFPDNSLFRISGDEFVIICVDLTYDSFNRKVARLSAILEQEKPGATTLGQAWSENDLHVSVLFNQANIVLDARKQNTRDRSASKADYHLAVQNLVEAINREEYIVYLQPKVSSRSAKVCGAEALIRHMDPKLGLVSPSQFIAQMEKDGLVKFIDLFVFRKVCHILRRWMNDGISLLPISLNFSRVTLLDDDLVSSMLAIKEEYLIDSRFIEIEITESFGALERNLVKKVAQAISDAGFCICIDDFGSEYSNLSILTTLPLGILKLDKSLINNLCTNANNQVFVDGFVNICRKLGIRTVAEGVETESQKDMVVEMGCDMIQGYFYDKPIPIANFEQKYLA